MALLVSANAQHVDLELGSLGPTQSTRLQGYPSFSHFIAKDKDAAIYRKYASLSARNLLYLQSELHELEAQLEQFDQEDAKGINNGNAQKAARSWKHFSDVQNERAHQHVKLQQRIRVKVKEYQNALLLESQILALDPPSTRTLTAFRRWFTMTSVPVLWGRDQHLFDNEEDLVALAPVETDRLNILLQKYFGWFFRSKNDDESTNNGDLFYYPQRRIQRAGAIISVLFSAFLLVGAIVSLLLIGDQREHLRVGIIMLFTCMFALVVGLLTNARRAEIFGATAAYAAVLVVFVGNNGTGKSS